MPAWIVLVVWLAVLTAVGWRRGAFDGWDGFFVRVIVAVVIVFVAVVVYVVGLALDPGLCFDYWADCDEPSSSDAVVGSILTWGALVLALLGPAVPLLWRGREAGEGT